MPYVRANEKFEAMPPLPVRALPNEVVAELHGPWSQLYRRAGHGINVIRARRRDGVSMLDRFFRRDEGNGWCDACWLSFTLLLFSIRTFHWDLLPWLHPSGHGSGNRKRDYFGVIPWPQLILLILGLFWYYFGFILVLFWYYSLTATNSANLGFILVLFWYYFESIFVLFLDCN